MALSIVGISSLAVVITLEYDGKFCTVCLFVDDNGSSFLVYR